jgi:hypothetical protein
MTVALAGLALSVVLLGVAARQSFQPASLEHPAQTGRAAAGTWAFGALAQAGAPSSTASAERLAKLMESKKLTAVGAEDPSEPGRFVAAQLLARQLLVVAGRCEAVEYLRLQVEKRAFADLYADLHGCAIADTRFFVQDMGANGLRAKPAGDGLTDVVYEGASRQLILDGDWRRNELDEAGYKRAFEQSDARYDKLLALLAAQAGRDGPQR